MKRKTRSTYNILNDGFSAALEKAFREKFSIEVETVFNIIDMVKVTTRTDENPFTQTQHDWIGAFSTGYRAAMDEARKT
ncbi:MAG: hypothetical protein NUW14_10860 [Deltaproteobacteria bacterium]|nr:hypothetical protein [Deltaproteobacteria bacterium]